MARDYIDNGGTREHMYSLATVEFLIDNDLDSELINDEIKADLKEIHTRMSKQQASYFRIIQ
jgi:hypothetical protein